MSRFPDFMHVDLTKVTCGGYLLLLFSLLAALGTVVGAGALLIGLFPGWFGGEKPDRWVMGLLLVAGLAVGAGFYQLGRLAMRRLGVSFYREGYEPPEMR